MDEDKILDKLEKLGVFFVSRLVSKQSDYYGRTFYIPDFYCYTVSDNTEFKLIEQKDLTDEQYENAASASYDCEIWFINCDSEVVCADDCIYAIAFTNKHFAGCINEYFLKRMREADLSTNDEICTLYLRLYRKVKSLLGKRHERLQ